MSVLIKGMEMPTSCEKCPCKTADAFGGLGCQATGYIPLRKANQNRPDWCPLIPVPEHGDLIDRDAYEKLLRGLGSRDYRREKGTISDAIKFLHPHYTPAIIPAEEGEI